MHSPEYDNPFVAVSGPPGCGKTTAAIKIASYFNYSLLEEHPEKNIFVADATRDPARWAFNSEVAFLMLKLEQNKEAQKFRKKQGVVQDTPDGQDVYSYGRDKLRGAEWELFLDLYEALEPQLMKPSLIVCLEADAMEVIRRIQARGREYEQQITPADIQRLTDLNHDWIKKSGIPTVYIETDHLNIAHDIDAENKMIDFVREHLHV